MAENGADVFNALTGDTTKGTIRATAAAILEKAPAKAHELCHAAKKVNPDIISLCHEAPSSFRNFNALGPPGARIAVKGLDVVSRHHVTA